MPAIEEFLSEWATAEQAGDTATLVRDQGSWRLAAIHLSFIAGSPGAPPIPAAGRRPGRERSTA